MTTQQLRSERLRLQRELEGVDASIAHAERMCRHTWGKTQYEPIEHPGYQFQGDPPGTMGVDRQLPCYIPASTTKQWSRTCATCGKKETTRLTKMVLGPGAIPGTTANVEVPDFGDDRTFRAY